MGAEKGGSSEQKGKLDKLQGYMRVFGWAMFIGLNVAAVATANPGLSYVASEGLAFDMVVDANIKGGRETVRDMRKPKKQGNVL
jgi:hypothetical protein